MKILAIETSCDDTAIAILEVKRGKFTILSNIVSSQQIHANYGGVFPMMAKREHQRNLPPVLIEALMEGKLLNPKSEARNPKQIQNSKFKTVEKILEKENTLFEGVKEFLETHEKPFDYAQGKPAIDLIAVTNGPGLEPCLHVGVNFAKALSYFWDIPVVPINHIEAHILVNFLENPKVKFPALSLVVSGGHTQLILVKLDKSHRHFDGPVTMPVKQALGWGKWKYKIIGETRDDAAGECFDKAARILGLGYPGGPIIARLAEQWKSQTPNPNDQSEITLPRPMMHSKDYNFSFSGLKTAVLYRVRDEKKNPSSPGSSGHSALRASGSNRSQHFVSAMCFAIQDAICDVLVKKTINAAKAYKAKTIILGGGVSANQELRRQLKEKIEKEIPNTKYLIPDTSLSTDNALMIAVAGYFNRNKKTSWQKLKVNPNLRIGK